MNARAIVAQLPTVSAEDPEKCLIGCADAVGLAHLSHQLAIAHP